MLPWTILLTPDSATGVFSVGLVSPSPLHLTDTVSYLSVHTRGLPRFLLAWPVGVGAYLLGVASAVAGSRVGREDRRLTAGLLGLAGLSQVLLAVGLSSRQNSVAIPIGALLLGTAVWWFEWPGLVEQRVE